eukprot:5566440-Lingulodinium_polyedra.AAC.1
MGSTQRRSNGADDEDTGARPLSAPWSAVPVLGAHAAVPGRRHAAPAALAHPADGSDPSGHSR